MEDVCWVSPGCVRDVRADMRFHEMGRLRGEGRNGARDILEK